MSLWGGRDVDVVTSESAVSVVVGGVPPLALRLIFFIIKRKQIIKKMRARDKCKWKKSASCLLFGRFTIIHGISDICEHTGPTNTYQPASICTFVEQKSQ